MLHANEHFNTIQILYCFCHLSPFQAMHSKFTLFTFNAHAQWLVLLYNSSKRVIPKIVIANPSKYNHLLNLWSESVTSQIPIAFSTLQTNSAPVTNISWCNQLPKVQIKFVLNIMSEKNINCVIYSTLICLLFKAIFSILWCTVDINALHYAWICTFLSCYSKESSTAWSILNVYIVKSANA